MLASSSLCARSSALGLVIAASLVARSAIAQAPPDLPPLSGPPVQPAQPGPPAPSTPPQGAPAPGKPGPGHYVGATPPPTGWMSPQEIPPGFSTPYPYAYPYYYPTPRAQVDYRLPPPPPRRLNSAGMMAGGILAVVGGLAGVIGGAVLVSTATNRIDIYCDSPSFPCAHMDDNTRKTGGALLMAAGAVVGALGIPLWVIGARKVPIVNEPSQPGTPAPRPAFVPEVRVGAGTASVSFLF